MKAVRKIPAIASDIDGVLYKGSGLIGRSRQVLQSLLSPLPSSQLKVPLVLLTNGGGWTEATKAERLNKRIGFSHQPFIQKEQIVQSHTPLSDSSFQRQFDKCVLIDGRWDVAKIVEAYGFQNYMLLDEVRALHPEILGFTFPSLDPAYEEELLHKVQARHERSLDDLRSTSFSAVMVFCDVANSDIATQIFADVIASKDGTLLGERRKPGDPQVVQYISTNNDVVYADSWPIPRFASRRLILFMEGLLKAYYGLDLEVVHFGKPEVKSFKFAQRLLQNQLTIQDSNAEISNYYMIGDNPGGDIEGGNRMGWTTFLVRSGVYLPGDDTNSATYVVDDFEEAVTKIFELEDMPLPF